MAELRLENIPDSLFHQIEDLAKKELQSIETTALRLARIGTDRGSWQSAARARTSELCLTSLLALRTTGP